MTNSSASGVPRQPEDPKPKDVLEAMQPCEPYIVGDLTDQFGASRWTVQRRLETLREQGKVNKKKHTDNRVSWWIEYAADRSQ